MRRRAGLLTGLLCCLLAGCFTSDPMRTTTYKDRFQNPDCLNNANIVNIEVRLIETRYGDNYINREVWDTALDEQAVEFEKRGPLQKNGLRVGRVAGALPPRLQELMTLERSCLNPRMLILGAGNANTIHLGPVLPECQFQIEQQGRATPVELAKAQFSLLVTPLLTEDGNVKLRFTPKVEFGDSVSNFLPAKDRSGWIMEVKRPSQVYPELSWEVNLAANTFLVVGGALEAPASLGHQAFVDRYSVPPRQRLLVLRTGRVADSGIDAQIAPSPPGFGIQAAPTPLALQAAEPTARAYHR